MEPLGVFKDVHVKIFHIGDDLTTNPNEFLKGSTRSPQRGYLQREKLRMVMNSHTGRNTHTYTHPDANTHTL